MAGTSVLIPTWPSCMNCISWSADSDIAIGLGENVDILTPKLHFDLKKQGLGEVEDKKWVRLRLTINAFTEQEWPYVDYRPFRIFSIGEEQSPSLVAALAWSPAGLARHRRCALAVLTTNHVLSIWAADANPANVKSWRRVLTINPSLRKYFEKDLSSDNPHVTHDEAVLLRSRIVAFSWIASSQGIPAITRTNDEKLLSATESQYMVLSNDIGELVAIEIQSTLSHGTSSTLSWRTNVHSVFRPPTDTQDAWKLSGYSTNVFNKRNTTAHLSLTPWSRAFDGDSTTSVSTLAYIAGQRLLLKQCVLKGSGHASVFTFDEENIALDGIFKGLTHWITNPQSNVGYLISCTREKIVCTEVPMQADIEVSKLKITTCAADEHWDTISGVAWARTHSRNEAIHYAFHLSNGRSKLYSMTWPLGGTTGGSNSRWIQCVKHYADAFSDEYKLFDHVQVRTWGLTAHPSSNCVAICISIHPSDMIQYKMSSEQLTNLIISDEVDHWPVLGSLSAESSLFAVSRFLQRNSEGGMLPDDQALALNEMLGDEAAPDASMTMQHLNSRSSLGELLSCLTQIWNPRLAFARQLKRQVAIANSQVTDAFLLSSPQEQIVSAVLSLPAMKHKATLLVSTMFGLYTQYQAQHAYRKSSPSRARQEVADRNHHEQCEICDSTIAFESVEWARCTNNHQFARCGLTLLAIQSPGISKYCGLCSQRYLKEDYLHAQEEATTSTVSADAGNASLIHLLCAAFDFCVCCGGKFVG